MTIGSGLVVGVGVEVGIGVGVGVGVAVGVGVGVGVVVGAAQPARIRPSTSIVANRSTNNFFTDLFLLSLRIILINLADNLFVTLVHRLIVCKKNSLLRPVCQYFYPQGFTLARTKKSVFPSSTHRAQVLLAAKVAVSSRHPRLLFQVTVQVGKTAELLWYPQYSSTSFTIWYSSSEVTPFNTVYNAGYSFIGDSHCYFFGFKFRCLS